MPNIITGPRAGNYLFGWAIQTAQGTANTTFKYLKWLDGTKANPIPNVEIIPEGDGSAQLSTAYKKFQWWEWSATSYMRANEVAAFMACLFGAGSDTSTLVSGAIYEHVLAYKDVYQSATSKCAMLTLQIAFNDVYASGGNTGTLIQLGDCIVNTIKVSQQRGGLFKCEMSGYGVTNGLPSAVTAAAALPSPTFDTTASGAPGLFYNNTFTLDSFGAGSVQNLSVIEYSFTVTRGVNPEDLTTVHLVPESYVPRVFLADCEYTCVFQNWAQFYNVFTGSTSAPSTFEVNAVGPGSFQTQVSFDGVAYATSAAAIQATVQNMIYTAAPLEPKLSNEPLPIKLTAKGRRVAAGNESFAFKGKNATTTAFC